MPNVPTTEPDTIYAGETLAWTKHLADWSPATYTLKYVFQKPGSPLITITATTSGGDFAVSVSAAITAGYLAGNYRWTSFAETVSERYPVETGLVTILPSLLAAVAASPARQILAAIQGALIGRIPNGLETTNIDGQLITLISLPELAKLESRYKMIVAQEDNAAAMAAGLPNRRAIFAQFTSTR